MAPPEPSYRRSRLPPLLRPKNQVMSSMAQSRSVTPGTDRPVDSRGAWGAHRIVESGWSGCCIWPTRSAPGLVTMDSVWQVHLWQITRLQSHRADIAKQPAASRPPGNSQQLPHQRGRQAGGEWASSGCLLAGKAMALTASKTVGKTAITAHLESVRIVIWPILAGRSFLPWGDHSPQTHIPELHPAAPTPSPSPPPASTDSSQTCTIHAFQSQSGFV